PERAACGRSRPVRERAGQVLAVSRSPVRESVEARPRGSEATRSIDRARYREIRRVRRLAQIQGGCRRRCSGRKRSRRRRDAGIFHQRTLVERRSTARGVQARDRRGTGAEESQLKGYFFGGFVAVVPDVPTAFTLSSAILR